MAENSPAGKIQGRNSSVAITRVKILSKGAELLCEEPESDIQDHRFAAVLDECGYTTGAGYQIWANQAAFWNELKRFVIDEVSDTVAAAFDVGQFLADYPERGLAQMLMADQNLSGQIAVDLFNQINEGGFNPLPPDATAEVVRNSRRVIVRARSGSFGSANVVREAEAVPLAAMFEAAGIPMSEAEAGRVLEEIWDTVNEPFINGTGELRPQLQFPVAEQVMEDVLGRRCAEEIEPLLEELNTLVEGSRPLGPGEMARAETVVAELCQWRGQEQALVALSGFAVRAIEAHDVPSRQVKGRESSDKTTKSETELRDDMGAALEASRQARNLIATVGANDPQDLARPVGRTLMAWRQRATRGLEHGEAARGLKLASARNSPAGSSPGPA